MKKAEEYADNKFTPKAKQYAATSSIKAVYDNCIEDFNAGFNSRQSEIDELNQAVDNLMKARHELQEEVERMRSELDKIYMYAEQMSIDLIGYNGLIDGSHESLDNYKNHMQSLTTH